MRANGIQRDPLVGTATLPRAGAASQPDWYVDPIAGNDGNDGSADTPLATLTEWAARIGQQQIQIAMTVHILSDLTPGDTPAGPINVGGAGGLLKIQGEFTVFASSHFTAVTAADPSSNQAWQATAAALPGLSSWNDAINDFFRVRLTSGAGSGMVMWPAKDLGALAARFSWPMTIDPSVGAFGQSQGTFAASDTFDLEVLPSLQGFSLVVNTSAPSTFQVVDCNLDGASFDCQEGNSEIYGCQLLSAYSARGAAYVGCGSVGGVTHPQATSVFMFGGLVLGNLEFIGCGQVFLDQDILVQTGSIEFFGGGDQSLGAVSVFDWPSLSALEIWQGITVQIAPFLGNKRLWGFLSGGRVPVRIQAGSFVLYDTDISGLTIAASGATSDVSIGDSPVAMRFAALPFVFGSGDVNAVMATDQTNATAVLIDLAVLQIPVAPNTQYIARWVLPLTSGATDGYHVAVSAPAGATLFGLTESSSPAGANVGRSAGTVFNSVIGAASVDLVFEVSARIGATGGTLKLQFAQSTHADSTAMTVQAGSFMRAARCSPANQVGGMCLL